MISPEEVVLQAAQKMNITDELLGWVKRAIDNTGDFLARETPLFIQELLAWVFVKNLVVAIVLLSISFICFTLTILSNKLTKNIKDPIDQNATKIGLIIFSAIIGTALFLVGTLEFGQDAIKVKVAPRVYLVEWISEQTGLSRGRKLD